jgi:hypothetical protein
MDLDSSIPANEIEGWLTRSDSFGICLTQMKFKRFGTDLPPLAPATAKLDPLSPQYNGQFAEVWVGLWWKGWAADRPARIQAFLANATALGQVLAAGVP